MPPWLIPAGVALVVIVVALLVGKAAQASPMLKAVTSPGDNPDAAEPWREQLEARNAGIGRKMMTVIILALVFACASIPLAPKVVQVAAALKPTATPTLTRTATPTHTPRPTLAMSFTPGGPTYTATAGTPGTHAVAPATATARVIYQSSVVTSVVKIVETVIVRRTVIVYQTVVVTATETGTPTITATPTETPTPTAPAPIDTETPTPTATETPTVGP